MARILLIDDEPSYPVWLFTPKEDAIEWLRGFVE